MNYNILPQRSKQKSFDQAFCRHTHIHSATSPARLTVCATLAQISQQIVAGCDATNNIQVENGPNSVKTVIISQKNQIEARKTTATPATKPNTSNVSLVNFIPSSARLLCCWYNCYCPEAHHRPQKIRTVSELWCIKCSVYSIEACGKKGTMGKYLGEVETDVWSVHRLCLCDAMRQTIM